MGCRPVFLLLAVVTTACDPESKDASQSGSRPGVSHGRPKGSRAAASQPQEAAGPSAARVARINPSALAVDAPEAARTLALVKRTLPPKSEIESWESGALSAMRIVLERDLGFGMSYTKREHSSEQMHCDLRYTEFAGKLVDALVSCSVPERLWTTIGSSARTAVGPSFSWQQGANGRGYRLWLRWRFPRTASAATQARLTRLGVERWELLPTSNEPPQAFWQATAVEPRELAGYLVDPLHELYIGNCPGPATWASGSLAAANEWPLMQNVLYGPNPEGRVIAAFHMYSAGRMSAGDRTAFARIAAEDHAVRLCEAWRSGDVGPADALRSAYELEPFTAEVEQ